MICVGRVSILYIHTYILNIIIYTENVFGSEINNYCVHNNIIETARYTRIPRAYAKEILDFTEHILV
jgi:hypothetical protein